MTIRTFKIRFDGTAIVEIDDAVFAEVDDEWRSYFYDLRSLTDIARHVGYNLVVNRARLSRLDGWANHHDTNAMIVDDPDWEIDVEEI